MNFLAVLALVGAMVMPATEGYKIGDTVEDFSLKNIDGTMVSMANYPEAKGFILTFTCNTCPWSVLYEDRINDLNKKFASKGWPVIAINPNDISQKPGDSMAEMKKRAAEKSFTFPYVVDETQEIAKAFGATRTPHMFIVKKQDDGSLRLAYIGALDDSPKDAGAVKVNYIANAIKSLEANKPIVQSETKAIGCTIKWKQD